MTLAALEGRVASLSAPILKDVDWGAEGRPILILKTSLASGALRVDGAGKPWRVLISDIPEVRKGVSDEGALISPRKFPRH